jgi:hypothetical protein
MIRMSERTNFRPSAEAKGYLDKLKDDHIFGRSVDGYAFAAAVAMKEAADIDALTIRNRTDLTEVATLDDEVRLALESGAIVMQKRRQLPAPADGAAMVEIVSKYAEVGIVMLRERWNGKTALQIQHEIKKLMVG